MNINLQSLDTKRKINQLAEIANYAVDWNDGQDPEYPDYVAGGRETMSHVIACCIVQWFGIDGCETQYVYNKLKLNRVLSIQKREQLIVKLLKNN